MRRFFATLALSALPVAAIAQPVGNGSVASVSSLVASALNGNSYMVGSSITTVALASNLRYVMTNPPGSGHNCIIYEIQMYTTLSALTSAHFWYNPTTGLPATTRTMNNLNTGSSNTASCTVKADAGTTALSGGTDTGIDVPLPGNQFLDIVAQTFVVAPGTSTGFNVPFALAASGSVTVFERESPVGGS